MEELATKKEKPLESVENEIMDNFINYLKEVVNFHIKGNGGKPNNKKQGEFLHIHYSLDKDNFSLASSQIKRENELTAEKLKEALKEAFFGHGLDHTFENLGFITSTKNELMVNQKFSKKTGEGKKIKNLLAIKNFISNLLLAQILFDSSGKNGTTDLKIINKKVMADEEKAIEEGITLMIHNKKSHPMLLIGYQFSSGYKKENNLGKYNKRVFAHLPKNKINPAIKEELIRRGLNLK